MSRGNTEPWFALAVAVLRPPLLALTRRRWTGLDNIPAQGGAIVVCNHVSYVDPLTLGHFVYAAGRYPRYLAKDGLFRTPVVRRVLVGTRQIPVHRGTREVGLALRSAIAAVRAGEVVCVYPEGTLTRDPDLWPMAGRTGAARIALATGAPVIPVAQWGAHELLPPYSRRPRLRRVTVQVAAGRPVDLSRWSSHADDPGALHAATDEIMDAVTDLLVPLRGGTPPRPRWDPRSHPPVPPTAGEQ